VKAHLVSALAQRVDERSLQSFAINALTAYISEGRHSRRQLFTISRSVARRLDEVASVRTTRGCSCNQGASHHRSNLFSLRAINLLTPSPPPPPLLLLLMLMMLRDGSSGNNSRRRRRVSHLTLFSSIQPSTSRSFVVSTDWTLRSLV